MTRSVRQEGGLTLNVEIDQEIDDAKREKPKKEFRDTVRILL